MKKGLYMVIDDGPHIFKQGELVEVKAGITVCPYASNGKRSGGIYKWRLEYIGAI